MDKHGRSDKAWQADMFRLLAENVLDHAIFLVDPEGRVLTWNKGAECLTGFTEQEIVGQHCDCLFTPEDVREGIPLKELEQALHAGRGDADRWQVRKDGGRFWASGTVTPLRDEAGILRGFARIMRDRTELKSAEEIALGWGRPLPTDHATVLIAHCNADRRYKFVNQPYAARFGLAPREIVGQYIRDVLGEMAYAAVEWYVDAALAGERVEFEAEMPYAGQGPQVLRCAYDPEFDAAGQVKGFVAAIVDVTDHKHATAALRYSEERFARFMQHLPGLAWIKDLHGRYVFANDAAMRAFRMPRAELYGKSDADIFPAETAAQFQENDRLALEGGPGIQVVETLLQEDGVLHHSLVSKFPIPGPDGQVALVGGMAIDITEQRQTRAVLEESERRFRQLAENIREVFWVSDPHKTQVLYVSPAYEDIWGRSCRSLYEQPRSFLEAIHAEDRDRVLATSLEKQERGEPADVEYRVVRPDGSVRWVRDRSFPVKDQGGRVFRIAGIADDITDRRQVEQDLRESEQRLRTLSDNVPFGAVYQMVGDREGRRQFTYISAGVERLFGVTPAETLADATAVYGLVHEEDRSRVAAAEEVALRNLAPFECEFRSWTRTGQIVWVHCRSAPRHLPSGQVAWEGIVMDVTARRKAQEELRQADRRKDEFLATLAHELRNPLAPISNGLQLLRLAGTDRGTAEKARGMMERQLRQMVHLIDDLLDVSRITRGKLQLRRDRVELAGIVQSAVEGSRPLIEAAGHDLTVTLPPEPVYLEADATRLTQVLGNLLTNAAKYTDRGGHIRLAAERQQGEVIVSVQDSGIGIAAEYLPRVFEMFSQVAPALERSQGGLGIGLSLVKGLVEMHGGSVEARSEGLEKGSEFTIRLPLPHSPSTLVSPPPGNSEEAEARPKKRILVADDNRDTADSLAMMLRIWGHEVYAAHDGQEAVETAAWFRPDVALLDIGMPRLNGYEAARRIREEAWGKKMILVAVTGWGQEEDKRRAKEAGFDEHLTKPVAAGDMEKLLDGVTTG